MTGYFLLKFYEWYHPFTDRRFLFVRDHPKLDTVDLISCYASSHYASNMNMYGGEADTIYCFIHSFFPYCCGNLRCKNVT